MSHVIGIDVSTTATKALVVGPGGEVVGAGSSSYSYQAPRPTWSEQHPEVWWEAAKQAIAEALTAAGVQGSRIDAVGLTGQMHGSVLLDANDDVIRPAILWNDQRSAAECDWIRQRLGRERLISVSGNDALTGFTAPKLVWVAHHEPENWRRVASIMLPKDYVRLRLTGVRATDAADGSGTILFELARRTWSGELLEALGIAPEMCPPVFEGPEVSGQISPAAAEVTGLSPGTPVVGGGGDQAANAVGVGAVAPGIFAVSLGTSGVVFATSDGPAIEPEGRVHAFCHAVPQRWHMMGVMLAAAGSLQWLRDALAPERDFADLVSAAAEVPAGCDGLLFLPYLSGERTPHPDPRARGAFVGLTTHHDLRHLTRAVLEGVAFGLKDGFDLMVAAGVAAPEEIRVAGGGSRSGLWLQILADTLGGSMATVSTEEGAAFGAGLLAAVGAGWYHSVEAAVGEMVRTRQVVTPSGDSDVYQRAHQHYQRLYPALRPTFHGE